MGLAEKSDAWKTPSVNIIPKDHQTSAGSPLGGSKSVVWALLYGNWSWGGNPLALHCNCKANMFYLEILGSFLRSDEIWAQHFGKVTMEAFVERNPDCKKQLSDRGLYFETTWEVTSSNPIKFTLRPCSNPCQVWWTCQSHFGMMSWTSSSLQKLLSDTRMFFFQPHRYKSRTTQEMGLFELRLGKSPRSASTRWFKTTMHLGWCRIWHSATWKDIISFFCWLKLSHEFFKFLSLRIKQL